MFERLRFKRTRGVCVATAHPSYATRCHRGCARPVNGSKGFSPCFRLKTLPPPPSLEAELRSTLVAYGIAHITGKFSSMLYLRAIRRNKWTQRIHHNKTSPCRPQARHVTLALVLTSNDAIDLKRFIDKHTPSGQWWKVSFVLVINLGIIYSYISWSC
jgi:hypothetical protein